MRTNSFKVKAAAAVAAAAIASFSLTSCGSDSESSSELAGSWDEVLEAANEEGAVTIYSTSAPDNLAALKESFEKQYPEIELTFVRGTDADILPKVEVEKKTGKGIADVHMTTDAGWIDRSKAGDYSVKVVGPDFDDEVYNPDGKSVMDDTWFVTSATVFGLGWNTDKYPAGLKAPSDVLAPALKGKAGVSNPSGIPTYVDMWKTFETDWEPNFVPDLAATGPRVYPSAVAITAALTSGEIWASPVVGTTVLMEKAKGAPVEFILPEDPFGVPWYSHVLEAAPNPNAAQVLANFLVTEEGQAAISHDYVAALPNIEGTGVPGADVLAQDIALPDPDTLTQDKVNEYQKTWEALFLKK